jgi:hypothetical protein
MPSACGGFLFFNVQERPLTASHTKGHIWGHKSGFSDAPKMPLTKIQCDRAASPTGKKTDRLSDKKGMYLLIRRSPVRAHVEEPNRIKDLCESARFFWFSPEIVLSP